MIEGAPKATQSKYCAERHMYKRERRERGREREREREKERERELSYTHLCAHETLVNLACRLLRERKK